MKFKKTISMLLIFTMLVTSFSFADYKRPFYDINKNTFEWMTESPKALPGINYKYRTLGFHAQIVDGDFNADIYFIPTFRQEKELPMYKDNRDWIRTDWQNLFSDDPSKRVGDPITWNTTGIYEEFMKKYRNSPAYQKKITEFFARANIPLKLDAVITKVIGDTALGKMTVNNGWPTFDGPIYDTYKEFAECGWNWTKETKKAVEEYFYNIQMTFKPQPVGPPIPKIQRYSATQIDGSYTKYPDNPFYHKAAVEHRFKEGEEIQIDAYGTYFPNPAMTEKLSWTWQKEGGGTTTKELGNIGTPFKEKLSPGTYNVTLSASSIFKVAWSQQEMPVKSEVLATTKIIIEPTLPTRYNPIVQAVVEAPDSLKYELNETTKKIPATITATVSNIDLNLIQNVYLNLKDQTNKTVESMGVPSLSGTLTYEFDAPWTGDDRDHRFEGYATVVLKNGQKINSEIATAKTFIYKKETPNIPPVPVLNLEKEMLVGNTAYISGAQSYDLDGTVVQWDFSIPQIGFSQSSTDPLKLGKKTTDVRLMAAGTYTVILGVTDDKGAYSETSESIVVTPPTPSIEINVSGTLKENRKVTFSAINGSEMLSPVGQNYTWTITPIDAGIDPATVKMVSNRGQSIDVLFKKSGQYTISTIGTNTYNRTGKRDIIVNVQVDMPPIPLLYAEELVYRDDTKKATIYLSDNSYSSDNDFINTRTWYYRYDSNNNGVFADEQYVIFKQTTDFADNLAKLETSNIGKYEFGVESIETFGQETILAFVTTTDYKRSNGTSIVNVDNLKPKVGFDAFSDKKIDIALLTDYEGQNLLDVEAWLNRFKRESNDVYQNVNFTIISDKKYVGRYLNKDASGYTNVPNVIAPKYQVANWNGLIEYSDNTYTVTVSTTRRYTNETVTTNDVFPSRVKQSVVYNNNEAKLWLLENGDLYFAGTNSANNFGSWGGCAYAMKPTKVLTGVKQIEGGDNKYFLLQTNGEIYVVGHSFSAFYGYGLYYVKVFNQLNWSSVIGYLTDMLGNNPYSPNTYNTYTGDTGILKVYGVSNIDYIWSNGNALVTKRTDGKWFGFGSGLNAFGLSTGFKNVPRTNLGNYTGTDVVSIPQMMETWYHIDNQNTFVELTNLSNLNSLCGGIAKVEPNKAYARNGNVYTFQETPTTRWDSQFRVINSNFGYQWAGTWQDLPKSRSTDYMYITADTVKANGVDRTPYLSWIKEPLTGQTYTVSNGSSVASSIPDTSAIGWIGAKESTMFEYNYFAYTKSYTHISTAIDPNYQSESDEGRPRAGYIHTYSVNIGSKVLLGEAPNQAGFKTYAIDASKITQMPLREGSERYLIYLSLGDSFKNVNKSFGDYLKNNKIKAKISTKAEYLDQAVDPSTQINLRQTLNAVPNGKFYGEFALEWMLSDIMLENEVPVNTDGGIYALVNEDSVNVEKFFADAENDPKFSDSLRLWHDPNHFENSQGYSAYQGNFISTLPMKFDKVGRYSFVYDATDNPSSNAAFANYRKQSENAILSVYVHRRPFAVPNLLLTKGANASQMVLKCNDGGSVDSDHQSEINAGITDVQWSFKPKTDQEGVTWQNVNGVIGTTMTQTLAYGETYLVTYRVKDKEGAWSEPVTQEIQAVPQLFMDANLRAKNPNHTLNKLPVGNNVTFHGVWSSYQLPHHLIVQMYDGNNPVLTQKVVAKQPSNYWSLDGNDVYWNDFDFFIPSNAGLLLKTYKLKISAVDSSNSAINKFKDFYITLFNNNSPPTISFTSVTPQIPYEGDSINSVIYPDDPDKDALKVDYYLWKDGESPKLIRTYSGQTPGVSLSLQSFVPDKAGLYYQKVVVTDTQGLSAESTISIWVEGISVNAVYSPSDPMAGEQMTFNISTTGKVDKVELILPSEWIEYDKRKAMGYKEVVYATGLKSSESYKTLQLDMNESQVNDFKTLKYQIWVTVPQSMTLKKARLRSPYTIIIRAWKGSFYKDYSMVMDLEGSVLQTIKMGTPNK